MKNVQVSLLAITFFLAVSGFTPSVCAQEYTEKAIARKYSEQPPAYAHKKPPPQATAMPTEDLRAAAPVTFDELRLFVRDWRKYARWLKTDGNEYKAVAYLGVSKTTDYPAEVLKWMDEHGWVADRFFLLERKFRMTLSVQEQEVKQKSLRDHINQQIKAVETNAALPLEQKREMKKQFEKTLSSLRAAGHTKAPVSPEEYELIKLNRDALMRILTE